MASQGMAGLEPSEVGEIERILGSQTFQGSASLRRLLQFLAEATSAPAGMAPGEYHIATTVLGRRDDFDPRVDSSVRVQMARLRSKLTEYFATEGAQDPVVVEIPKGEYRLVFRHRTAELEAAELGHSKTAAPVKPAETGASTIIAEGAPARRESSRRWTRALVAAVILLAGTSILFGIRFRALKNQLESARPPAVLREFWQPFLSNPETPLVVFSNSDIDVAPTEYSKRWPGGSGRISSPLLTGVGEVIGVYRLGVLLGQFNRSIQIKRSRLLSLDDVQGRDVIFVGGYLSNRNLTDILPRADVSFAFEEGVGTRLPASASTPTPHPLSAEDGDCESIITLTRGTLPRRSILVLAGTTTLCTQAAVEFTTREGSVASLMSRLGADGVTKPFKCHLESRVAKGVPLETTLVSVKRL